MLTLPIKRLWFNKIRDGIKKEEYRAMTSYYDARFDTLWKENPTAEKWICLRNGYNTCSPEIFILCTLSIGSGKVEWGAKPGEEYYILNILEVRSERPEEEAI